MICPDCGGTRIVMYHDSFGKELVYCDECKYEDTLSEYEKGEPYKQKDKE
jgi:hypothetical protein